MIPQTEIERVLDVDIHTIIEKYITVKREGANYKACCPFHGEKTPSLMISDAKGIFKCFGCGKSGNAVGFVMDHLQLTFPDAVREVAKQQGITVKEEALTPEAQQRIDAKESARACLAVAENYFHTQLFDPKNTEALNYALSRWDETTLKAYKIGFAPEGFQNFRSFGAKNALTDENMLAAGVLNKKEETGQLFDYFINRIIFPIHDKNGNIKAFIGREMSGNIALPKYLNSRETLLFKKSDTLFGFHLARRAIKDKGNAFLVEGNPDVIRLQSIGITNTVAPLGTALTPEHIETLKTLTSSITIIGDTDNAGKKAVDTNALKIIQSGMFCYVLTLPDKDSKGNEAKHDPDSFFTSEEQFLKYEKENRTDYVLFQAANNLKQAADDAAKRGAAISNTIELLMNFNDPIIINQYAEMLGNKHKPKKQWSDAVKTALKERTQVDDSDTGESAPLINRVESFITKHYDIRYNDINNQFQCIEKDKEATDYSQLNENNILRELRKHHLNYGTTNLIELLKSDYVEHFNPITEYFESLPRWDTKTDHIAELSKYIILEDESDRNRFERMFKKMFIRSIYCSFEIAFNKHCFVLVHERQSSGKTTFLRWLVPTALKDYYTEHMSLDKDGLIALTENFIINMDELSTLNKMEINALKSVLSKDKVKVRVPYERRPAILSRRCNFLASTNRLEFLNDETGNVRWICFHIKNINWQYMAEIKINEIWAQAYYYFKHTKEEYQLTADEIQENEMANIRFISRTPEMEILQRWFAPCNEDDEGAIFLTATEILKKMAEKSQSSVKIRVENVGRALTMLRFEKHSKRTDRFEHPVKGYWIRELTANEELDENNQNPNQPKLPF